jgi:hypothetical protein
MSVTAITPVPEPELLKLSALSAHSAAPFGAQSGASCEPELALPEAQAPHWARQRKAKVATSRPTTLPGRSGLTPRMLTAKAGNRLHENQLAANVGQ